MAGKPGTAGQQAHAFFLSLGKQQFVELCSASVKASRSSAAQAAVSILQAEHMPAEGWIVKIGRQTHLKTVKSEFTADDSCSLEIHAGRLLCWDQFDEGRVMFGHDNALITCRNSGSFGEVG